MAKSSQDKRKDGVVTEVSPVTPSGGQSLENNGKSGRQGDDNNTPSPTAFVMETFSLKNPKNAKDPEIQVTVIHFQGSFFTVPARILEHFLDKQEKSAGSTQDIAKPAEE